MANSQIEKNDLHALAGKMRYIGYGFCYAWSISIFSIPEFSEGIHTSLRTLSTSLGFIVCLVLLLLIRRHQISGRRTAWLALPALVAALGTLCYTVSPEGMPIVKIAGLTMSGVFIFLLCAWYNAYVELPTRQAVALVGCSLLTAAIICCLISLCPIQAAGLLVSLLPLIAYALLPTGIPKKAKASPLPAIRGDNPARTICRAVPWKALIGLSVIILAVESIRTESPIPTSLLGNATPAFLIIPGVIAVLCVLVALRGKGLLDVMALAKGLLLVLAVLLFLTMTAYETSPAIAFGTNAATEAVTWLLLIFLGKENALSASLVFYIGWIMEFIGGLIATFLVPMALSSFSVYLFVVLALIIFATVFFFSDNLISATSNQHNSQEDDEPQPVPASSDSADRSAEFALLHGLTPRESEVFSLWITGHGFKYIRTALFVSDATVKTHVHHIYEKCDVHSRAELLALYEKWLRKEENAPSR